TTERNSRSVALFASTTVPGASRLIPRLALLCRRMGTISVRSWPWGPKVGFTATREVVKNVAQELPDCRSSGHCKPGRHIRCAGRCQGGLSRGFHRTDRKPDAADLRSGQAGGQPCERAGRVARRARK